MALPELAHEAGAVKAGKGPQGEGALAILDVARVQLELIRAVRERGIFVGLLDLGMLGGGSGWGVGERR